MDEQKKIALQQVNVVRLNFSIIWRVEYFNIKLYCWTRLDPCKPDICLMFFSLIPVQREDSRLQTSGF